MPNRRSFFAQSAAAAAALASHVGETKLLAREPFTRTGPPRFSLGLAAYSLRPYFQFMKGKAQKAKSIPEGIGVPSPLTMSGFLEYCVAQGVEATELTSYFFESQPDGFPSDESLMSLRHEAYVKGLVISGTAIGNNFTVGLGKALDREITLAKRWIEKASVLGAPHIRFFAGTAAQLASAPTRLDEATDALKQCAELAAEKGIFLGVENHGGVDGDQMLAIMERIDSPWIGINLDTGNFLTDDPYGDIKRCAPYAVNVQVKTSMKRPSGEKYPADLDRVGGILRDSGYQGFVVLEYEEDEAFEQIPIQLDRLRKALRI